MSVVERAEPEVLLVVVERRGNSESEALPVALALAVFVLILVEGEKVPKSLLVVELEALRLFFIEVLLPLTL